MTRRLSCLHKIIYPLTAAIVFLLLSGTALAATITGVVMNGTTNKPSAGDTVALIRLQQGMQVAAHTTTDASGHYTLEMTDTDPMHLVRVTHDGANYFQAVPPGKQAVNADVYDAADKVDGASTEAEVQRIETDQNELRVTENYFVKNASSPPRTQFGPHAYEIYLPKDAKIVSSAALGPGSMPVQSSPMPVGTAGEYAFVFPVRPGETRFQVSYRLPYSGSFQFQPRVAAPVDNFALILPKSMHFVGTPTTAFQPIDEDVNVQTYLAKNVLPGAKLVFHISGTGKLPQETAASQDRSNGPAQNAAQSGTANPEAAAQQAAVNNTRPGIGLGVPLDTPSPLEKYKWWILSLSAVLLAIGAGVSMKQASPVADVATAAALPAKSACGGAGLLDALKEELFALETDRLEGRVTPEEYDRQKSALEIVLKRALKRREAKVPTTGTI
jgi:hypothetical protein